MAKLKRLIVAVLVLTSGLAFSKHDQSNKEFPVLKGPYLGQKPPGLKSDELK